MGNGGVDSSGLNSVLAFWNRGSQTSPIYNSLLSNFLGLGFWSEGMTSFSHCGMVGLVWRWISDFIIFVHHFQAK
ncbi:hypothetical protein EYC80_000295 [Monilinia laxa]|uniref:Uncharacterized protein n=1 Tax=Monilinia laxa TaxID=61186 RepID=A0A5N6KA73_MONLA|nr:hypothetical protein EYC80_000295 [Monilinia laxa]